MAVFFVEKFQQKIDGTNLNDTGVGRY